jgi:hypothetical protein
LNTLQGQPESHHTTQNSYYFNSTGYADGAESGNFLEKSDIPVISLELEIAAATLAAQLSFRGQVRSA